MKQRLLLALLMLFTSVGFVMGQEPSVGFKIVGTGPITINFRADEISAGELPRLVDPVYFVDMEGEEPSVIDDYTNATFSMTGAVTEFEVLQKGGSSYVAQHLTSLTITGGELETLVLGSQDDASSDCSYLPQLKTLNVQGNKLKHIPAKGNITSYQVFEQAPENIRVEVERDADNSITIDTDLLMETGLFTTTPATGYSIDFPDEIDANREGSTYKFTPKYSETGLFVQGEVTIQVGLSNSDPNYPRVDIKEITLVIPAPKFTFHISVLGNVEGCSATAYTDVTMNNQINDGDEVEVGPIYIDVEYDEDEHYISASSRENLDLRSGTVDEGVALAPGLYEYNVTGLGDPSFSITFAEQAPDMANIATAWDEGSAAIKLYDADSDADILASSVPLPQSVYARVTAKTGYLPSEVSVVLGDGTKQALTLTKDGDSYKSSAIDLKEGVNTFTAISKQGATVWNDILQGECKTRAKEFINNEKVKSALCSGIQWDMTMEFVDGKKDGRNNTFYVTNYNANRHTYSLATSGQNQADRVCNIYDLEGNCRESVAEKNSFSTNLQSVFRGGYGNYDISPASYRNITYVAPDTFNSFRFVLYVM